MVKRRRSDAGYSLTELIMVLLILALVVMVTAPLMIHIFRFGKLSEARTVIQRDARNSLETINRFLRQAQSATVTIDQAAGQPPHSRISFTTEQGNAFQFYQTGRTLFMSVNGTLSELSKNLRYIAFSYPRSDDPTIISVAITAEMATYEGKTKVLELSIEKVRVMN